jgi:hypothetical protein
MNTNTDGVSAMSAELGPLPEPLFLLHTGDLFGNERDEWEVQANSGKVVDDLAEKQPPGATLGLYDEHTVRQMVAAERERQPEPQPCALTWAIQRLNSTPYAMTKDECVEMLRGLRSEIQAPSRLNTALSGPKPAR